MADVDIQAAAQSLYGPASAVAPVPSTALSEAQAAGKPATPVQGGPSDAFSSAEKLFDAADAEPILSTYAPVARDIESAATERLGLTPDEASASASEWGQTFHRYGVSSTEAAHLVEIGVAALVNGVDDAKATSWRSESTAALTSAFGANAGQALADAKALVAKDPTLAAWLEQTGLGDHPKVVAAVAQRARQMRNSGRL